MVEFTVRDTSEGSKITKRTSKKSLENLRKLNGIATEKVDLGGLWKFKTDPENLGELYREEVRSSHKDKVEYVRENFDFSGWDEILVPSHWQREGYDFNGTAWYAKTFDYTLAEGIAKLCFTGVDYFCDVWFNGYYLGSHEGFYAPFSYDVTNILQDGQNIILVKVEAPNEFTHYMARGVEKKFIKGALEHWDANDRSLNPGGIWNAVCIEEYPDINVSGIKVEAYFPDGYKNAMVSVTVETESALKTPVEADLLIVFSPENFDGDSFNFSEKPIITPGCNTLRYIYKIKNPELWWTWDTGKPNLYTVLAEVATIGIRHKSSIVTGLREIRREKGWETYLNGRRIFYKGGNYLSDQLLSNMDVEKYETDILLAKQANFNMLRPFCVVEKREFYELCDRIGIMVYQDFPIQWSMSNASDLVRSALPQAAQMIHMLWNHPSVVIWCFGSEPGKRNFEKLGAALTAEAEKLDKTRIVQQANSWEKQWDFKWAIEKYDWRVDNHFYPGWYHKEWTDITDINKMNPEFFDFVTEFGAQALPCKESMEEIFGTAMWPPDWLEYEKRCFQKDEQLHWIGEPKDIDSFIQKSQVHQAFVLKYIVEHLRMRKFTYCNGALMFLYNDCRPVITWSVIDYYRRPKAGYYALRDAFAQVLVMMEYPREADYSANKSFKLFIANDTDEELDRLTIKYKILDKQGKLLREGELFASVAANGLFSSEEDIVSIDVETDVIELELYRDSELLSVNKYERSLG